MAKARLSIDEVATMTPLARQLGVNPKTLHAAIKAGHVESAQLSCGANVVVVKSAKAWAASSRKRGPKPKR